MINDKFGVNETKEEINFTLTCDNCGSSDTKIIPVTHYENNNYKKPSKITLKLYCKCCHNEYEPEIYSNN